jgi:hypothetical protein
MKKVHLNMEFAPRTRNATPTGTLLLVIALILFSIAALLVSQKLADISRQKRTLSAMNDHGKATQSKSIKPPRIDPAQLARTQFVRQTSRNLSAPWADLLTALEAVPSNVALLSIEPSGTKRSLSLTAEAAGSTEMLSYLQLLQEDKRLANVMLISHQVQLQMPGTPTRFKVLANWGESP